MAELGKENNSSVELLISPHEKDLGEFMVRRLLPAQGKRMLGPWVFFDHMGPVVFSAGSGVNVRPHPHINLATVTYLFDGEILHKDSLGSNETIKPGDINLMVAGKGIVHSERERKEVSERDHPLHGLQLWLALPEAYEEIEPAFYHYDDKDIPIVKQNDVSIRLMIGEAYGVISPVKTFSQTLYLEAFLKAGQSIELPDAEERALYVVEGAVSCEQTQVPAYHMAVFASDKKIRLEAKQDSRIAIIGGEKFSKRYLEWNFVSSRKDRIEQAKHDWKQGNFPLVLGDEEEFIPFPE